MYALLVFSVHVYYVNCNAKTQMGYLCALLKYIQKPYFEEQTKQWPIEDKGRNYKQ